MAGLLQVVLHDGPDAIEGHGRLAGAGAALDQRRPAQRPARQRLLLLIEPQQEPGQVALGIAGQVVRIEEHQIRLGGQFGGVSLKQTFHHPFDDRIGHAGVGVQQIVIGATGDEGGMMRRVHVPAGEEFRGDGPR